MKKIIIFLGFVFLTSTSIFSNAEDVDTKGIYLYNLNEGKEALGYLKKEAESGNPVSQRLLAYAEMRMGSMTSESLKWFLAAARQDELYAMIALGRANSCKMANECSPDNSSWSDYFIKEAKQRAENNDARAMRALGYYYQSIDDDSEMMDWWKKAAAADDRRAQFDLANAVSDGKGFYWTESGRDKDIVRYYEASANNGYYPAMVYLGRYYFSKEQYHKGRELIDKAVSAGYFGAFQQVFGCKMLGKKAFGKALCGNIDKDLSSAWGMGMYMSDFGKYTDYKKRYGDKLSETEKKEGEKYYQELKSKIPKLFGQRLVY